MGGGEMKENVLEGVFEGWHTVLDSHRIFIVKFPGPKPYTETHTSVLGFVASVMDNIELGKRVRITVEEVK